MEVKIVPMDAIWMFTVLTPLCDSHIYNYLYAMMQLVVQLMWYEILRMLLAICLLNLHT